MLFGAKEVTISFPPGKAVGTIPCKCSNERRETLLFPKIKDYFGGYTPSGPVEYIVAGLGNPGKEYENTRHNAGYLAVDYISAKRDVYKRQAWPRRQLKIPVWKGGKDGFPTG